MSTCEALILVHEYSYLSTITQETSWLNYEHFLLSLRYQEDFSSSVSLLLLGEEPGVPSLIGEYLSSNISSPTSYICLWIVTFPRKGMNTMGAELTEWVRSWRVCTLGRWQNSITNMTSAVLASVEVEIILYSHGIKAIDA
jgi:hypothetical protein